MKTNRSLLLVVIALAAMLAQPLNLQAQSFASYPAGDDVTSSLGQFQIVLDQSWVKVFDAIMAASPLANYPATRHHPVYRRGVFLSPTLFDPVTRIGRSDALVSGAPEDTLGALAGLPPGRTFISDSQLTVRPDWAEAPPGTHEVHTFIKSLNLVDSFTTRAGFAVKAGINAPTRPVSAGEVEAGSAASDFPANSFFNVFVRVTIPGGGPLPALHLVNVDPLLVEQTNIFSFPPRIVYQHGNSTAVSLYFDDALVLPDPQGGPDIQVPRGTLFGQLTLAGHGVGFSEVEIESFQAEIEDEMSRSMPINPDPIPGVEIRDFSPEYNAAAPKLSGGHFEDSGKFVFMVEHARTSMTNYVQRSADLAPGSWVTINTNVPSLNTFTFVAPDGGNGAHRFYRWSAIP